KSTRLYHPQLGMVQSETPANVPAFSYGLSRPGLAPAVTSIVTWRWRRNIPRRIGAGSALRSAKYPVEEVVAAAIAVTAAAIHADRHAHRFGRAVGCAFDGNVSDLAFIALEDGKHLRVAAVDILAQLQLAGIIHEGGLIGQMHRNKFREVDIDLAA